MTRVFKPSTLTSLTWLFLPFHSVKDSLFTPTSKTYLFLLFPTLFANLFLSILHLFLASSNWLLKSNSYINITIWSSFGFHCLILFIVLIICHEWIIIFLFFSLVLLMTSISVWKTIKFSLSWFWRVSCIAGILVIILLSFVFIS